MDVGSGVKYLRYYLLLKKDCFINSDVLIIQWKTAILPCYAEAEIT